MRVNRLELRDFRNHERSELALGEGLTVVCGPNGAGKTNLLEGLYFGLTGRSCRTSSERYVVRRGAALARVSVETEGEDGRHLLEVGFAPGEAKLTRVDGAAVERLAGRGERPLVGVFLPDRLELVKGAPATRRAHLDRFVAAVWPARAGARAAYGRALAQRNAALARVRGGSAGPALLDPWDGELARRGADLVDGRARAAALVGPAFALRAAELGLPGPAELSYSPRSPADEGALGRELAARRTTDLERGHTTHGPHRDDVVLRHGGEGLRAFGSQGQQRVGLLALLFAERDVLAERGAPPLMLLDDVMSELDDDRRERLAVLVRGEGQAVITTTDPARVPAADAATTVVVEGGAVRRPARAPAPA